ncbi:hypothetical protein MUN81_05620 [Hymenobacter sp. 5317J-9]|uniref:hypothetical protein n=1 Tax=Hymenobacter sp. 5317J-9 TaxID=2932250 RepID=UPI001FD6A2CF|nr:hypothetical protein [Hymenobacter sp. 5317J-9]UOQ98969.1 hypothetical protein MUN81_05620 [Hymenobacter sp. 5317J-9]
MAAATYLFKGLDGYAGFRHGREYELELAAMEPNDERPTAEIVVINPVSRLYAYHRKEEFNLLWTRK